MAFSDIPTRENGQLVTREWWNLIKTAGAALDTSTAAADAALKTLVFGLTSTATAAGTTTLVAASTTFQRFTGVTTQSIVLPNATTLFAGQEFVIINRSTGILTVKYADGTTLTTVAPQTDKIVKVLTIVTSNGTWETMAFGSAGGGGTALKWYSMPGSAPINEVESGLNVWKFSQDGAGVEKLFAYLKVPDSYVAGGPIHILIPAFSPSSSNTILMQVTAYLVRKNTDAIDSTTNSETSVNSALTNNLANEYQEFDCDITPDAAGQINATAVAAGDIIRLIMFRGTDTDTADIRVLDDGSEVTFS
jgi:hypothetical protein